MIKSGIVPGENKVSLGTSMIRMLIIPLLLISCSTADYLDKDFNQKEFKRKNVNEYDINGYTPLMAAVRLCDYEQVKELIAGGADVNRLKGKESFFSFNVEDRPDTNTALIIAVYEYSLACEFMGYEIEKKEECTRLFDHCIKYDEDIRTYQEKAAGFLKIIDLLLLAGADVKTVNSNGSTALHFAGDRTVAGRLLKAGADINAQDKSGDTLLMIMMYDDYEMIKFLLENGADPDLKDMHNETVYDKFSGDEDAESARIRDLLRRYMKKTSD